jgi:magnesium chelatase subunit D
VACRGAASAWPWSTRSGPPPPGSRCVAASAALARCPDAAKRVEVRPDDCRITRFKQRTETTVVFVVDASGSTAFNRLAEAKGAVELLLADCYVRRESVALIAFRGTGAELLLPPTRSLTRAKRSLAGLPGGGGTPLAAGLEAAADLADAVSAQGSDPDPDPALRRQRQHRPRRPAGPGCRRGRRDGAASRLRLAGHTTLFIDTSPGRAPRRASWPPPWRRAISPCRGPIRRPCRTR